MYAATSDNDRQTANQLYKQQNNSFFFDLQQPVQRDLHCSRTWLKTSRQAERSAPHKLSIYLSN